MSTRILALLPLLVGCLIGIAASPAVADSKTVCQQTHPTTGKCLVWVVVEVPGSENVDDGPKDTGSGQSCYWDGTKQGISKPPPGPVPCTSEYGYWSNSYRCYIRLLDPQPPAGDPAWKGHEPGDGAVYDCYQPQTDLLIHIWADNPPENSGAGPNPRDVAQLAIDDMALRAIDVGITPQPGANRIGLVGMPVWMWAANPDEHTYGPITATASAGGITITATANVQNVAWQMGDGTTVECRTPGTPYKAAYGKKPSPDCGHVYTKSSAGEPGGTYTVTATSSWVITWEGAGQTGTIRLDGLQRSVEITVGEAQVLVE
ncbi:hypothetical protein [Nocardioides alcanivorans]|uniref:hypothetical protein n=1 Tax=Nocardioides alcanivorans TaxID=2897352 RepID=UPI001F3D0850|nr:hypothetical protein [Nocardioides alcanivorans]